MHLELLEADKMLSDTVHEELMKVIVPYQQSLLEKVLTHQEWLICLQQIHAELGAAYLSLLKEAGLNVWFTERFLATDFGRQISDHICARLFAIQAESVREHQDASLLIAAGFNTQHAVQSNAQGFELSWHKQHK